MRPIPTKANASVAVTTKALNKSNQSNQKDYV